MNDYVGVPPQRSGFGFGRRTAPGAPRPASDSFTLSSAAQEFIAQERARRSAEYDAAQSMASEQSAPETPLVNDIDFEIGGTDTQYLEVELDPGEAVIAENGAMIWKDSRVGFEAILGDGSEKGLFGTIMSAGTNLIGGENLFLGEFRHSGGGGKARVALGGRTPGHVLPVRLEEMGGTLVCQRGAFLAAAKGISVSVRWAGLWTGMEGGEGFILQELSGTGWAFVHVGGTLIERQLKDGEQLHVDAGCIAAFEPSVRFDTDNVGGGTGVGALYRDMKNTLVGGEGWLFARLTGPGKVWIQSLPFRRLSRTVLEEAKLPNEQTTFGGDGSRVGLGDIVDGIETVSKLFK
ncbi:MAG: AIM24 family protein [Novosphingobium sp.]